MLSTFFFSRKNRSSNESIKVNETKETKELNKTTETKELNATKETKENELRNVVNKANYVDYNKLLNGKRLHGICVDVYDGDTVSIVAKLNENDNNYYKFNIRCEGYDTPEIRPSKTIKNREEHIQKAKQAKNVIKELILNQELHIQISDNNHAEKFGRVLATLFRVSDNLNINQYMIKNGYGYEYHGGTKKLN